MWGGITTIQRSGAEREAVLLMEQEHKKQGPASRGPVESTLISFLCVWSGGTAVLALVHENPLNTTTDGIKRGAYSLTEFCYRTLPSRVPY